MKRSIIKFLTIVLALVLIASLFTACAPKDSEAAPSPTDAVEPSVVPSASAQPAPENETAFKLPIVDEPIEYSCWFMESPTMAGLTTLNENKFYQEIEKRTNLHIEFSHPANFGEGFGQFAMSIASGDWPNTYIGLYHTYGQGFDYYVDSNIILDLNPLIDEYAPNYKKAANINIDTYKSLVTDSGYLPGFWQLTPTVQPSFAGPMVRADWLKELGAEVPKTYDELHDLLVKFKEAKSGLDAVMSIATTGLSDWLMNGLGTQYNSGTNTYTFINKDGKVEYTATSDAMKEYITLMNKWYG